MIKPNENQFRSGLMCRLLSVSRSGYYSWEQRPPSDRDRANQLLAAEIKRVFDDENGRPGAPGIARRLQDEGKPVGRHRIARIMRGNGWRAKAARKYLDALEGTRRPPTASIHCQWPLTCWHRISMRTGLARSGCRTRVPRVGITHIWTDEGWLYLAVVLELYSRRAIGWAISERMTATLVCDAPIMASYPKGHKWNRKMPMGVIVHSDRGSQYCSAVYQKLFRKHRLVCSMGKKGDCYDNAAMESWNHSFKVEAAHGGRFKARSDAKRQVFEYIEVHYNRKRLHSKLGYISPDAFESKKVA